MSQKAFAAEAFSFSAPISVTGDKPDEDRQFSGVAYAGGLITDHAYWDAVVFDLSTVTVPEKIPLLFQHRRDEPIGVITQTSKSGEIRVDGRIFTSSDDRAKSVAVKGDAGLPWQMSVGIFPKHIKQVAPREKVIVNGKEFTGPLAVFEHAAVREVSIVSLGADSNTSAHIFAHQGNFNVEVSMSDSDTREQEIATLKAENDSLKSSNATLQTEVEALKSKFEAARVLKRTEDVKAMFAAVGMEFSEAAAKPFIDMGDEQFSATRDAMVKLKGAGDKSSVFGDIDIKGKGAKGATFSAPQGYAVDAEALAVHERAVSIAAEKGIEYYAALQIAEKE